MDESDAIASTVHDLRASTAPFDDGDGVFVILVDSVAELSLLRGAPEEEGETVEGDRDASVVFKADSEMYSIKALRDDGATAEEWHRALLYLVGTRAAAKGGFDSPTKRSAPVALSPVAAALPPSPVAASPPRTLTAAEPDPRRAAWRPVVDPSTGRQYWHDENSMQSVWVLPAAAVDGAIHFADDWVEKDHPENGRPFWFSPSLKKSVWVKPKLATNEQRALSPARSALVNDWVERVDPGTGRVFQYSPSLKKCVRVRAREAASLSCAVLCLALVAPVARVHTHAYASASPRVPFLFPPAGRCGCSVIHQIPRRPPLQKRRLPRRLPRQPRRRPLAALLRRWRRLRKHLRQHNGPRRGSRVCGRYG